MRRLIKQCCPPLIWSWVRRFAKPAICWQGNYANWSSAQRASDGYDDTVILERVANATQQVMDGKASAERDGVTFGEPHYHFALLTLLYQQALGLSNVNVIDFGGGLGSVYWNNRPLLQAIQKLHWCVVEQPEFVRYAQAHIANEVLSFHLDTESALAVLSNRPSMILLGSVLQYLPEPEQALEILLKLQAPIVFIDRTVFNRHPRQQLTVQQTSGTLGNASYPCWLLDYQLLCALAQKYGYELMFEYNDSADTLQPNVRVRSLCFKLDSHHDA